MPKASRSQKIVSHFALFFAGVGAGWFMPHEKAKPLAIVAQSFQRQGYHTVYDGRCRNPYYVMEHLTYESLQGTIDRSKMTFKEDQTIQSHIRAHLEDYKGSGFDRGHMAAAANQKANEMALKESFLLTNICPQHPSFNRGLLARFEKHVRSLVTPEQSVHVFTGPLYLSRLAEDGKKYVCYQVIGEGEVAVPTHFFKLLRIQSPYQSSVQAYIFPNTQIKSDTPFESFATSQEEVERLSGILF